MEVYKSKYTGQEIDNILDQNNKPRELDISSWFTDNPDYSEWEALENKNVTLVYSQEETYDEEEGDQLITSARVGAKFQYRGEAEFVMNGMGGSCYLYGENHRVQCLRLYYQDPQQIIKKKKGSQNER